MNFNKKEKYETEIEAPASDFAETRGWMQCKIMKLSKRAWPDRLFIRRGRVIFIEFKRPGEEPTQQQLYRHNQIRAHGVEVFWTDNLERAKEILI